MASTRASAGGLSVELHWLKSRTRSARSSASRRAGRRLHPHQARAPPGDRSDQRPGQTQGDRQNPEILKAQRGRPTGSIPGAEGRKAGLDEVMLGGHEIRWQRTQDGGSGCHGQSISGTSGSCGIKPLRDAVEIGVSEPSPQAEAEPGTAQFRANTDRRQHWTVLASAAAAGTAAAGGDSLPGQLSYKLPSAGWSPANGFDDQGQVMREAMVRVSTNGMNPITLQQLTEQAISPATQLGRCTRRGFSPILRHTPARLQGLSHSCGKGNGLSSTAPSALLTSTAHHRTP